MIAVVTISKAHFLMYCRNNNLNDIQAKQVCRLSDVEGRYYSDIVLVEGANNVTDYVLERIRTI